MKESDCNRKEANATTVVDPLEKSHRARSNYVRELVQGCHQLDGESSFCRRVIPVKIVQFWNDLERLPGDVRDCMETWRKAGAPEIENVLYDEHQARDFINRKLGKRYALAFDKCYHPAMQSDYFRLCYIYVEGGCYIDADDIYRGSPIDYLFRDGRLKIQPLCYDIATNKMVPQDVFTKPGVNNESWIFYFNNNPLIASSGDPLVSRALIQATLRLEGSENNSFPEIQSTTGPGNLTESIFFAAKEGYPIEKSVLVLNEWENIAENRWELSYRKDQRNWRLANCGAGERKNM